MEQENNYKERMLDELILLVAKIERLNIYLQSLKEKPVDEKEKEKINLMWKQLETMMNYRDILTSRILLKMK